MKVDVYCDGGAHGNPGPAAAGIVLSSQFSVFNGGQRMRLAIYLGNNLTNNQAEYLAVIAAFKYLHKNFSLDEIEKVTCHLDSELIVRQLNKVYKVKNQKLRALHKRMQALTEPFKMVEYQHVPREQNQEADQLVNLVLDLGQAL